jgi:hypothetical protein
VFPGVESPGHHCPNGKMQNLGDFVISETIKFFQHENLAMLWREFCQGRVDLLPDLTALAVYAGIGEG